MKYEVESMTQLKSVLMENDTVVVMFTQPRTCVPCRQFKPVWEAVSEMMPDLAFAAVDLDNVPEAMAEYSLMSVPTVMLFENGEHSRDLRERTAIKFKNELSEV